MCQSQYPSHVDYYTAHENGGPKLWKSFVKSDMKDEPK